ncbi:hypothetical protein SAMN05421771_4111 [Granulicella pectinivorans]|uniref:Uncharacterized protein n=1 Tax=Granulicella pectinivorans TaxID=474950 RepID=A0A1I6N002_9BACT|nr:hypothetical protein [Granulicella pectinivorans]SFS21254.1 hypothetical protein SAMN05421771_4111 [Granulicella pectinivorans]
MRPLLESIDKTALAISNAGDGAGVFFRKMSRDMESAAEEVHNLLGGAFQSLDGTITKLVTTHTKTFRDFTRLVSNSFAEMFRGIAASLATPGLKNLEQGIAKSALGALGKGDQPPSGLMGTLTGQKGPEPVVLAVDRTNVLLQQMLVTLQTMSFKSSTGGTVIPFPDSASTPPDGSTGGNFMDTILGIGLGAATGGYAGGRAVGGDVTAGMTI